MAQSVKHAPRGDGGEARSSPDTIGRVQAVTGQRTLLAGSPVLRRLRALPEDSPDREAVRTVAALSINGVAAGLQNTG